MDVDTNGGEVDLDYKIELAETEDSEVETDPDNLDTQNDDVEAKSNRKKKILKSRTLTVSEWMELKEVDGSKVFQCLNCNKTFSHKCNLKRHVRLHTEERPFSCDVCERSFNEFSTLEKHKRIHTGERPFTCSVCQKGFSQNSTLKTHMRTHTGEKPFTCDVCRTSFTHSNTLKIHRSVHTGEKPYSCDVCQAAFTQSTELNIHKKMHTGEKLFTCSECQKVFSFKSQLTTHMRLHTGEKPYTCNICQKSFAQSGHLNMHKKIHTVERPYKVPLNPLYVLPSKSENGLSSALSNKVNNVFKCSSWGCEGFTHKDLAAHRTDHGGTDTSSGQSGDKDIFSTTTHNNNNFTHSTTNNCTHISKNSGSIGEVGIGVGVGGSGGSGGGVGEDVGVGGDGGVGEVVDVDEVNMTRKDITSKPSSVVHKPVDGEPKPVVLDVKSFICQKCSVMFGSNDELKQHEITHTVCRSVQFKCAEYEKTFKNDSFTNHKANCSKMKEGKPFLCDCGEVFVTFSALRTNQANVHSRDPGARFTKTS